MANESTAELPCTTPLKRSGSAPAGTTSEGYTGVEKRISVRYKCEGTIEMHEGGCEAPTWATITDVSMHGCYVDTHATYSVGTALGLKLDVNGISLQTRGVVRVNYPYLGMGIAFTQVSQESQDRLREILRAATRPTGIGKTVNVAAPPARSPLGAVPPISDSATVIHTLIEFFQQNQMLTREGFLRILWKSAATSQTPNEQDAGSLFHP